MTFLDDGTTKITATPIKWKEGMVNSCYLCNYQYVFFVVIYLILGYYIILLKGLPNGVVHEKNGKKRSHEEDRLLTQIYLFFYVIFSVFAVGKLNSCDRQLLYLQNIKEVQNYLFSRGGFSPKMQNSIFCDYDQIKHAIYSLLICYIQS